MLHPSELDLLILIIHVLQNEKQKAKRAIRSMVDKRNHFSIDNDTIDLLYLPNLYE